MLQYADTSYAWENYSMGTLSHLQTESWQFTGNYSKQQTALSGSQQGKRKGGRVG